MKSGKRTYEDFNKFWKPIENGKGKLVKWYYLMFNIPIKDLL